MNTTRNGTIEKLEKYADSFSSIYDAIPPGKAFRLTFDPVICNFKLITRDQASLEEVRNAFSAVNPKAFIAKQYGYSCENYIYAINKFGYFAPGLVFEVLKWIALHYGDLSFVAISNNCKAYIDDNLMPLKSILANKTITEDCIQNVSDATGRNADAKRLGKPEFKFRNYQVKSIVALLSKGLGRGLIEIPTSGGKSFIIANFIWNVNRLIDADMRALIFVPNTQLVEQFYKDLLDYGYQATELAKFSGVLTAKQRKQQNLQTARIIIANRQYLYNNWQQLPNVDILICDEVHTATAKASKEFITHHSAKIKIGCSGTIPKDAFNRWELFGMFCKLVYQVGVTELQSEGFVSNLKMTLLQITHRQVENDRQCLFHVNSLVKYHPDQDGNSDVLFNDAYNAELQFYQTECRTLYSEVFKYLSGLEENILVLFDRLDVGHELLEMSQEFAPNKVSHYIDGATPVEIRENIRQELEKTGNNILVGNVSIIGTGINIKRLTHVVFIASSKSFSRVIQSIGRILRLHSAKNNAHLIDIVLNTKYSQRHYAERVGYYAQVYNKKQPDEIKKIVVG